MMPTPPVSGVQESLPGMLNVATGLLLVLGLIFAAAWLLRKTGRFAPLATDQIKILASRSVGSREKLVIVEVDNRGVLLGITNGSINKLYDFPVNGRQSDFADLVEKAGEEGASVDANDGSREDQA